MATIIALCALFASIQQGCQTRRHDRLSVRPVFSYVFYFGDDGAGWRTFNTGIGPARLRGFRLFVDSKPVEDLSDFTALLGVPSGSLLHFSNPNVGDLPGHEGRFLWFDAGPGADALKQTWTRALIQACYCSVYDECWLFSTDGSWDDDQGQARRDDGCSPFANGTRTRWWKG